MVRITYSLSKAGQKASLLAGGDGKAIQKVDVPRDHARYADAVALAYIDHDGIATLDVSARFPTSYHASQQEAINYDAPPLIDDLIDDEIERRDRFEAVKAIKDQQESEEKAKARSEWLALPMEKRIYFNGRESVPSYDSERHGTAAEIAELKAECERLNSEHKARIEAEQAAKVAKEKAAKDALQTWALANGSELLKARVARNFEWQGLARQEFAAQTTAPLGEECENLDGKPDVDADRTTPTLDEIRALETVEKLLEGKPVAVRLAWVTYTAEAEDEYGSTGDEEKESRCEIEVEVTCPDGSTRAMYFLPEQIGQVKV